MSNFWNKPKSLYDLADEIANGMNPQISPQGGGAAQSFSTSGYGATQNNGLLGTSNDDQGNGGSGSSNPQSPKQQPNSSWLDHFLAGRSRDELQKLKYSLERASLATAAFGVLIGDVLFVIDPSKVSVAVVIGGTTLMTIGLQYLSSLVDEYMNTH